MASSLLKNFFIIIATFTVLVNLSAGEVFCSHNLFLRMQIIMDFSAVSAIIGMINQK